MTVQSLTFAALLLTAAPPALAGGTPPAQVTASQAANAPLPLQARWTTSREGGVLVATLTLVNTSSKPIDLLVARGSSPGARVNATMAGTRLEPVYAPSSRFEGMSRMGPMPVYAPIAGNRELLAGTFRFTLPAGSADQAIELQATIQAEDGRTIVLPFTVVVGAEAV